MFNAEAPGIPCPRCSADPESSSKKKRVRSSLLEFVVMRSATCGNCGLVMKLVLDDKGKQALQLAGTLKATLDESAAAMRR